MYKNLLIIFNLFIFSSLYAQRTGGIKGTILTSDGQPAEAVSVGIKNTTIGTITDEKGCFQLVRVKPGTYTLRLSGVGLVTEEKEVTVTRDVTVMDFRLRESSNTLKEVAVSGSRRRYKVDAPSNTLRLNEPLLEVPQNIQVVTSDQIKDQQIFNMLEGVSRNVSGITMQEHWGNYARINARGDRVAPFRNGMNIEATWGPLNEDMSFVDRIEFVKGPAGFMLANGNPSGFYNVITKKPTGTNRQSFDFTAGSFNTYRATADFDGKITTNGKLQYRLNLMGQLSDSWRPYDFTNRYAIAPVLRYKFDDKNTVTAEYTYQFQRQASLGSAYLFSLKGYKDLPRDFTNAAPNYPPMNIHDHSAFLTYEHKFSDKWKFTAQGAYFNYHQSGTDSWIQGPDYTTNTIFIKPNGDITRALYFWEGINRNKFAQAFVNGEAQTGSVKHRILAGVDFGDKYYIADFNQSGVVDVNKPFNIYNPDYSNVTIPTFSTSTPLSQRGIGSVTLEHYQSFYAQDELGFFDQKLRITLAGRYTADHIEQYGTPNTNHQFTPRAGISYSIDRNTSVYGVYDQSFLPQTGLLRTGDVVKPVTGNNIEGGLKRDWFDGKWNTSLSIYQIIKNNQTVTDPSNAANEFYVVQLGQTKTNGVEFDARGEIISGLNLMVNYAYTNSHITKDTRAGYVGTQVPGFAKHVTNAWLTYRLQRGTLKGLGFSTGYQWQLKRLPWNFSQGETSDLPNYFRLDGAMSYQYKKFNFGVNVNNILNAYLFSGGHSSYLTNYASTVYTWQAEAPVNVRATIGYRF
ncbi:TonB-dependent receptor [Mucilaginibacter robiniae]|uniref:TonB-dependent receptor n=1 Tax=Mucilaginibacter robiniae TaxID=2728022 RepID=A0A7L5E411_9SPHI|nr:TonB-dependent receptor [Mucilaginibacter robiniae]QJD97348.1 TonB-dependent receptor [Mucilaginibacter robiniae]